MNTGWDRMRLCAWLLLLPGGATSAGPAWVDEVAAVVNRQVITRSEVLEEAVLIQVEGQAAVAADPSPSPETLSQVLDLLINHRVILDEAAALGLPPVLAEEREQLLEGLRRRFPTLPDYRRFLSRHALSEEIVAEVLVRHLRVDRIREAKLRTLPEITQVDVERYYRQNRPRFGNSPLAHVAEAIRLRLMTQQHEEALARWTYELRRRSEVKILVDFSAGSGE